MKTIFKPVLVFGLAATAMFTACKKDQNGNFDQSNQATTIPSAPDTVHLAGLISTSRTLDATKAYYLDGVVYVTNGAELTIPAGTHLVTGRTVTYGTSNIAGVLVITKGSKIFANGTAADPVVFRPDPANTSPVAGSFGGLILLGDAPTNQPATTVIEGIPPLSPPADITYGGTDATDNSGSLTYVRIEYPGYRLNENNEINGLTLGGVGSGTTLSYIQVSYSADDSFEFFGGTVNADHLVALSGDDDDFDFDFGYSGTINYAIGLKNPSSTHSTSGGVSDSNGIESDNNGTGAAVTPVTKPVLRHFTILGYATNTNSAQLEKGNHWRRLSSLDIQESVIGGYDIGAQFEGITATGAIFSNNLVHAFVTPLLNTTTAPGTSTGNTATVNATSANAVLGLTNAAAFYTSAAAATYSPVTMRPTSASPAYGNGTTTFWGAVAPNATATTIWTAQWTDWTPLTHSTTD